VLWSDDLDVSVTN